MNEGNHFQEMRSDRAAKSFRVSDVMLCVLAFALAAGLLKRHAEEPAMAFRLNAQPPLSVWTRLVIGHTLSSIGLVFGLGRMAGAIRERKRSITFGTWIWAIIGLFLFIHVSASVMWALTNRGFKGSGPSGLSMGATIVRVALMTFNQACFDALAWVLAAVWIASALLRSEDRSGETREPRSGTIERQDIAVAIFTGLTISATIFQRFLESAGY